MSYQHSKVDDVAEKLVTEIGFDYARDSAPIHLGQVFLSHDPTVGGYQLRRVVGHSTTAAFLSEDRYDEAAMIAFCMFALTAVTMTKKRVVDNVLGAVEALKQIVPEVNR